MARYLLKYRGNFRFTSSQLFKKVSALCDYSLVRRVDSRE
jgi:hypothetical protein